MSEAQIAALTEREQEVLEVKAQLQQNQQEILAQVRSIPDNVILQRRSTHKRKRARIVIIQSRCLVVHFFLGGHRVCSCWCSLGRQVSLWGSHVSFTAHPACTFEDRLFYSIFL